MPNLTKDQSSLLDLLEQAYELMEKKSPLSGEEQQLFLWLSMGTLYYAGCLAKENSFPNNETLDLIISQENLGRLSSDTFISEEKKKKMLGFYQAILAVRGKLLKVDENTLKTIPNLGFALLEQKLLKTGIKGMATGNHKTLVVNQTTPHAQLIEKFEGKLFLLEIIDSIFKFCGRSSGLETEIAEVKSYIKDLNEKGIKGVPVSHITEEWKANNKNQQLFKENVFSWLLSPSIRTHAAIVKSEEILLSQMSLSR
jgi:hypothetical protein